MAELQTEKWENIHLPAIVVLCIMGQFFVENGREQSDRSSVSVLSVNLLTQLVVFKVLHLVQSVTEEPKLD